MVDFPQLGVWLYHSCTTCDLMSVSSPSPLPSGRCLAFQPAYPLQLLPLLCVQLCLLHSGQISAAALLPVIRLFTYKSPHQETDIQKTENAMPQRSHGQLTNAVWVH